MKKRQTDVRIRLSLGYAGLAILAIAALLIVVPRTLAEEPAVHDLLYANANDYTTVLSITNPTDETISFSFPCKVGPCPSYHVAARSTWRSSSGWPRPGVNVEQIDLDERLVVYTEIVTPTGTFCRAGDLDPLESADFYDLVNDGVRESYIVVAVPRGSEGMFVSFDDDGAPWRNAELIGDAAIIVPVVGPHVRLHLGYGPGYPALPAPPFVYATAIVVHDATGAINFAPPIQ